MIFTLPPPHAPVDTRRLHLRCVEPGDASATARLLTPAVSTWLASWPSPVTTAAAAARITAMREAAGAGQLLCFAIERRDDPALMGWVIVARVPDDPSRGGLGYWLGEAYHGHGYMAEAAEAAVAAGFARFRLAVIEAGAQPENAASLRVMAKLGMTAVGRRVIWASARAREETCEYYAITREAFAARGSAAPAAEA
jgi:ribosomal-protein-alanine N-acetyltransferase